MAVVDWDNLTAITRAKVLPGIEDQITIDKPLLGRLLNKAQKGTGKRIEKVVEYALSTQGGWYSGLDILDTAQEDTRTRAFWEYKQIHQPIVLKGIDLAKNSGKEALFDLALTESKAAMEATMDKMGDAIYTARTGDAIDSLVDATDDDSNVTTYGGINRSTYSWWDGQYNGTGGTLSLSMLATQYDAVKSGSDYPSILVSPEAIWTVYEALLQPQMRYNNISSGYTMDGGVRTLSYRGTPWMADEDCTAGYLYFLNEKYLNMVVLNQKGRPTDKKGFAVSKFREPTDQDGKVSFILWYGDLICTQPRRQGVIRSVS